MAGAFSNWTRRLLDIRTSPRNAAKWAIRCIISVDVAYTDALGSPATVTETHGEGLEYDVPLQVIPVINPVPAVFVNPANPTKAEVRDEIKKIAKVFKQELQAKYADKAASPFQVDPNEVDPIPGM